jgi:5-methylcytosine-specific restriction endonuclease McrA
MRIFVPDKKVSKKKKQQRISDWMRKKSGPARVVYVQDKRLKVPAEATDVFLESYEWRRARMEALKKCGARCQCCGAAPKDGIRVNVDHIKPRKLYPELALDLNNLQILCEVCNHGKGNWDMTDWRVDGGKTTS